MLEWLGVQWTPFQIRETAEMFSAEFYWMTLAELKAFTVNARLGKYGKEWGKMRPLTLMTWMNEWQAEVLEAREYVHGMAKPALEARPDVDPDGNPIPYVDSKRISEAMYQALGAVRANDGTMLSSEDAVKEHEYQREREAYRAVNQQRQIAQFAQLVVAGEDLSHPDALQFYENHKSEIEQELQRLRSTLNP